VASVKSFSGLPLAKKRGFMAPAQGCPALEGPIGGQGVGCASVGTEDLANRVRSVMPSLAGADQLHPPKSACEGEREFRFTSPDFPRCSIHRLVEGQMVRGWDEGCLGLHCCDHRTRVDECWGLLSLRAPLAALSFVRSTADPDALKGHGVPIRVDCSVWRSSRVEPVLSRIACLRPFHGLLK